MKKTDVNTYFSTRRIEALTDGVFAIAMTLLVLDLKVSELGQVASSAQLLQAILDRQESITSFIVSFLLLGSLWAVHMRQFEYIKQADRHLTMINTLRLLAVVMIPISTSLSGSYQSLVLGRIALPINFFILAALGYWQWRYAVNEKSGLSDKTTKAVAVNAEARNRSIMYTSLAVVILSVAVGELAFLLFLIVPLTGHIYRRLVKN